MVISTGITLPRIDSVWALYALQNSMMFTPCGPRAVPTGGAGVAAPAWSCTLTSAAIFFLGGMFVLLFLSRGHDEEYVVRLCHLLSPSPVGRGNLSIVLRPRRSGKSSDSLDLGERELDRGLAAEDLDEGLDPLRLGVDLGDRGVQRGERAVGHHDGVGDREVRDLDRLLRGRGGARRRRTGSGRLGLGAGDDGRGEHALDL